MKTKFAKDDFDKQTRPLCTFVCRFARFSGRLFLNLKTVGAYYIGFARFSGRLFLIGRVKVKNQIKFYAKTSEKRLKFNDICSFSIIFKTL